MSLKDFQIIKKLGEGSYSTVYKVKRLEDSERYALKKVKITNLSIKEKENALNQIRILASVDSEHIVSYKEAFFDEESKSLCMVMEYANEGDLLRLLSKKSKSQEYLDEETIWKYLVSILKGLNCLHKRKILHRDLKTANVFIHNGTTKLGDLNVSKVSVDGLCQTQTGTPYYASPQVWKDLPYDEKSDIWSLGCVLYEMICLKPPFFSEDLQDLYKKVNRGIYAKLPSQYSTDLAGIIRLLLQVKPQQRPTCEKILNLKVVKRKAAQNEQNQDSTRELKDKLLKTIKPSENFVGMNEHLPRSKYNESVASCHRKVIKSVMVHEKSPDQIKDYLTKTKKSLKQITEIQPLPTLEHDRKLTPLENSERNNLVREKQSHNVLPNKSRKKSQLDLYEKIAKKHLQSHRSSMKNQISELRLPKVSNNRTRKNSFKEKGPNHSKSVRHYKIYNN